MGDVPLSGTPRTCGSPQDATDFGSDVVPNGSLPEPSSAGPGLQGQPEGCLPWGWPWTILPPRRGCQGHPFEDSCGSALGWDWYYWEPWRCQRTNTWILGWGHSCQQGGVAHCASSDTDPAKGKRTSPPADARASVVGPAPTSWPAKSWTSLFQDSKPSSSYPLPSPLPPRLWFPWKLSIPLPPLLPWSLKSRLKSRKGWFQFQRIL